MNFEDYLKLPGVNASLLVHALKSWKQFRHVQQHGYKPKIDTRVGSALHSMAELLPVERFQDLFTIMPDFASSPDNVTNGRKLKSGQVVDRKPSSSPNTHWVAEQERAFLDNCITDNRTVLKRSEFKRCLRMLRAIQANPVAMALIQGSEREVTLQAEIARVKCKGRIDGLSLHSYWDLKSTTDIAAHAFGRTAANLRYVFKMAFYWRLLAEVGEHRESAFLIAVQDAVPHKDGSISSADECAVYEIPMIAIENEMPRIERLLGEFKQCEELDQWPGVPDGDLVVPNWAMEEPSLVD